MIAVLTSKQRDEKWLDCCLNMLYEACETHLLFKWVIAIVACYLNKGFEPPPAALYFKEF